MEFNYQARTQSGEIQSGVVEASSEEAAISLLQKSGLYVTFLEEVEEAPFYFKRVKIFENISLKDIVLFSRLLSIMFASKVSLFEALRTLASQTTNLDFREKILKISEDVESGATLSSALSKYPENFSTFYIAVVKAGEASGKLSEALNYLAEHLERKYHLIHRIRGAMIYPTLVISLVLVILSLIIFIVIPNLTKVLIETGQTFPTPIKIMIGFSDFARKIGWILILFLLILIIFAFRFYKTKVGKEFFDNFFLKLPMISYFLKITYLSIFAENLSTLISSGLPIIQCLEITGKIIGNSVYQKVIFQARDEVRRGVYISSVLARFPKIFPPVFTQMVLVGEQTGTLDKTLMNLVSFYEKEIERSIETILGILEPALIIFLGVVVGSLVAAVILPLYRIITF